ncbi:hypothetical protein D3C72_404820 [compost metagenome]
MGKQSVLVAIRKILAYGQDGTRCGTSVRGHGIERLSRKIKLAVGLCIASQIVRSPDADRPRLIVIERIGSLVFRQRRSFQYPGPRSRRQPCRLYGQVVVDGLPFYIRK